jgi:hypothetical protein
VSLRGWRLTVRSPPTPIFHLASIPKGMLRDPHFYWVLELNPVPVGVRRRS